MNVERFMAKGVCRCFLTVPVGILILGIHSILITKRIIIVWDASSLKRLGQVIETLRYTDGAVLAWKSRHLKIPLRKQGTRKVKSVQKTLAAPPKPV